MVALLITMAAPALAPAATKAKSEDER